MLYWIDSNVLHSWGSFKGNECGWMPRVWRQSEGLSLNWHRRRSWWCWNACIFIRLWRWWYYCWGGETCACRACRFHACISCIWVCRWCSKMTIFIIQFDLQGKQEAKTYSDWSISGCSWRWCRFKIDNRVKARLQWQTKGRTPEWVLLWRHRDDD